MTSLKGVYPAILTPFDGKGRFDASGFEKLIQHLYSQGVHGLYVCGVTGEGLMMSLGERQHVADVAIAASRGKGEVIVHVGCGSTADAVLLARHAAGAGATAVGCLAPYTSHFDQDVLVEHFRAVVEAAQPLPAMIYYTPETAPSLNTYGMLERLLDIPGIAGVKFTGTNASELACAIFERSGDQTVFSGVDEMFLAALLMGAQGGIGSFANLVPGWFVQIYEMVQEGRWQEAKLLQHRMIRVIRIVERYPFISALKNVVRWQGFDCGEPRRPHQRLTPEQHTELCLALSPLLRDETNGHKAQKS